MTAKRADDNEDGTDRDLTPGGSRTPSNPVERRRYRPDSDVSLTTRIVEAVAAAEDVEPASITSPPLYEVVDVDALERTLFGRSVGGGLDEGSATATFHYRGFDVHVERDGTISVNDPVDPASD